MESIIVGIILGLLVLFILITLNKILNKERELNQKMGYRLGRILNQVTQILADNPNFEYQCNQFGSGDVCYASTNAVVVFTDLETLLYSGKPPLLHLYQVADHA